MSSVKLFSEPMPLTVDHLLEWFPDERWAIIERRPNQPDKLFVEWLSPKEHQLFHGIVGKVCYEATKGFSAPCAGCPCVEAMRDQRIHVSIIATPKCKTRVGGPDLGEMIYTIVSAVPVIPLPDGTLRVLEFSFDVTEWEMEKHRSRMTGHELAANLCKLLEGERSRDLVEEFVLVGALCMGRIPFLKASFLLPGESDELSPLQNPSISRSLTLFRNHSTVPGIDRIQNEVLSKGHSIDLSDLRALTYPNIERTSYQPPIPLTELLSQRGITEPERVQDALQMPIVIRLHSRKAIVPILGYHRQLHGLLLVKCHSDTLMTDDELRRLSTYGLFVSTAYVGRDIASAYGKASQQMRELTEAYGDKKVENMLFTAGIVTGMGHDLRRSIVKMGDWSSMLIDAISESKKQSDELRPIINAFNSQLEFQKKCIKRIVTPARLCTPWSGWHNLRELVDDVVTSFRHTVEEKGLDIAVTSSLNPKCEVIPFDKFLIEQLLTNLIDNSLHWMSKTGKKRIEIKLKDGGSEHVIMEYRDSGPGIAKEIAEDVWKPFFTLKSGGLGLGMFIIERIVKAHGGTISSFLEPKQGACFQIQLPVGKA